MQKTVPCIADITDRIDPFPPHCQNSTLYEAFRDDTELMVAAVVDQAGRVLGLIERHAFNLTMAAEYGRALYGNKPVTTMMDSSPLMVDIATPLHDFTHKTLSERPSELMRGFIATSDGRYAGVGTSLSVLRAISGDLQRSLVRQREMTSDLIRLSSESQRHQTFLNMVIQNIPAMVLVKNASDQRIILINEAGEDMLGVTQDGVVGRQSSEIMSTERAALYNSYDQVALQSQGTVMLKEEQITDSQGRLRTIQLKKTVLRTPSGEADSILTLGIDLTEQKQAEARIAHLAHFDPLTGLANRALFAKDMDSSLSRVQRLGHKVALLCLDLDRFKAVNDSYGHIMGDRLLIEVAERLRACVRKSDVIARMGGDEFAVIQDIDGLEDTQCLAKRIVEAMKQPMVIEGVHLEIGVSIGVALAPEDGMDTKNLLSRADLAMYSAKAAGRNGWRLYSSEMDAQLQGRIEMEQDLKSALSEGQFQLYYQPLLNLNDNEIVSFEALIRWRHPIRGMVSPAEFIPLAEECGLIGQIGEWVLEDATRTAAQWPQNWRVAVNISPLQFRHKSLVNLVERALTTSGLPPARLELEITESVILEDETHNLGILNDIRALGVRIAMDDFGTGYSSLSYLRTFPFDKIKIDQSFVRDLPHDKDALSIVRAITEMAQSLGVLITAEGVETQAQMDALRQLNCGEAQGYLIGRPAPDISAYCQTEKRYGT
ncbi:putative bifunctional diguanylate cyclase/phosphodiesterase [Asticcacaulis sp. 201]|uniref:putative bifunctional diguanylate cyclase/phosphodiesterase n=1 Tax=Asticcacaulis sp. 201 TaxID=3028787 RepID=UPI00291690F4|nr:EAL domain-containing protein [Asticcacaulis sp. 201]MDV6329615.1 EAL domain-containing protein [Asticcacaulis sp. 201]